MTRFLSLATALVLLPPLAAADLTTLKGLKHSGEIVAIDERAVVVKADEGEVAVPLPEILRLTLREPPKALPDRKVTAVELVDGTLLRCVTAMLTGRQAQLELLSGLKLTVDLTKVVYVLQDAHDPATLREWNNLIGERTRSDRFFVRRDNRLDGLEGVFGDASADGKTIAFTDREGEQRNLPLNRIAALLFNNRLEGNIPETVCRVIDTHQSVLIAQKAVLKDGMLSVQTVAGVTIELPSLETVVALDYSKDKIVYLSDLKPIAEDRPFDELAVIFTRDVNLDNQPIQLEGVPFPKGIVLHAPLSLTYDIGGEYKEFKTVLGVDTAVQTPSHVRLTIEGDGRKLFETEVRLKDSPKPIVLDVKKVRQLTIKVVQAEGLPFGHQATLADAKVTK